MKHSQWNGGRQWTSCRDDSDPVRPLGPPSLTRLVTHWLPPCLLALPRGLGKVLPRTPLARSCTRVLAVVHRHIIPICVSARTWWSPVTPLDRNVTSRPLSPPVTRVLSVVLGGQTLTHTTGKGDQERVEEGMKSIR